MEDSMMKYCLILFPLLLSCTSSLFNELELKEIYPETSSPAVSSLTVENGITINWKADPASNSYLVYRDTSLNGSFNTLVYEGKDLSFIDTGLQADQFYYYKLAKKQGWKEFSKSHAVTGYASNVRRDYYEDNNSRDKATKLGDSMTCSLFYFQDASLNAVCDKDWFYTDVPANKTLTIVFGDFNNLSSSDMLYSINDANPQGVISEQERALKNTSNEIQRFYIQVYPDKTRFVADVADAGGKFGSYSLKVVSLVPNSI
jgi:hypothetical protein